MMELIEDIAAAITDARPSSSVYIEALPQGMLGPCFFIRELSRSASRMVGERWRVEIRFMIEYYPSDKLNARGECDAAAGVLFEALENVETDTGLMRGVDRKYSIEKGVLKLGVSFEYFIRRANDTPKMGTLVQRRLAKR